MRVFLKRWIGFSEKEERFFSSAKPLVIMGRGHSGTRVFSEFCEMVGYDLDAKNIMSTGDASNIRFTNEIKKIALCFLKNGDSEKTVKWFKAVVWSYYNGLQVSPDNWGWKFPETYLIAPIVIKVFPNAKILHIVRDGRDIAFKTHQTDRPDRPLGRLILKNMGVMDKPHYVQAAASWRFQVDGFDRWKSNIPINQLHEVTFESFIQDPLDEGQKIADFLGKNFSTKHKEHLASIVDLRKLAQYKKEDPFELDQILQMTKETLKRWKYH
ncbi:MAG: sulfotransferase family protein [Cyclobacteriaceae bacterium]